MVSHLEIWPCTCVDRLVAIYLGSYHMQCICSQSISRSVNTPQYDRGGEEGKNRAEAHSKNDSNYGVYANLLEVSATLFGWLGMPRRT